MRFVVGEMVLGQVCLLVLQAPYYLHLQDKRAKPGNLPKRHVRL